MREVLKLGEELSAKLAEETERSLGSVASLNDTGCPPKFAIASECFLQHHFIGSRHVGRVRGKKAVTKAGSRGWARR